VASDGDNGSAATAASGPQSTDASTASAQVGSPVVSAPVRVLSDGDDAAPPAAGAAPQSVSDSAGAAQVGSPGLFAPARVLSDGGTTGADGIEGMTPLAEGMAPLAGPQPEGVDVRSLRGTPEGSGLPDADGVGPETTPALRFVSGAGGGAHGVETLGVAQLGVAQLGELPLTGLAVGAVAGLGMCLLAGGSALRLVPGGRRR
jgi:hypothetical protein